MSENENEFVQTPEEETAPEPQPSEIHDAVRNALAQQGAQQISLAPCPCGTANFSLVLDLPQGSKVGRGTCGACGIWGIDFLAPRSQDKDLIGRTAAKAWNEAPRAGA